MGDFSVSCAMSGISLMHEPVAFFPLVRCKFWEETMSGLGIVTNNGTESLFTVATLPIFGTIGCYGDIEKIEENDNTRAIERFTGKKISAFIDDILQGQCRMDIGGISQEKPKATPLSACVVHSQMYKKFSTTELNDKGNSEYSAFDGSFDLTCFTFELLGFKVTGQTQESEWERPKTTMEHPKIPNFVIKVEGFYTYCFFKSEKIEYVYQLKQVLEAIKKLTKYTFSKEVLDNLRNIPSNILQIQDSRDIMREFIKLETKEAEFYKKNGLNSYQTKDIVERAAYNGNHFFHWILAHGMVSKYWPEIDAKTLDTDFAAFQTFKTAMSGANRLFMPTWNGSQYGNHHMQRAVHREAIKILNEKINKNGSLRGT